MPMCRYVLCVDDMLMAMCHCMTMMVRYYFDIKIYIREHLELELKSKLKLSNMCMYTLYHTGLKSVSK